MGPPWRPSLVSQGLCLAASHAAVGNAALVTDVYCTGFPGAEGKPKGDESSGQQLTAWLYSSLFAAQQPVQVSYKVYL